MALLSGSPRDDADHATDRQREEPARIRIACVTCGLILPAHASSCDVPQRVEALRAWVRSLKNDDGEASR